MTMAAISETIAATESGSQPAVSEKERYKFGVALKRATLWCSDLYLWAAPTHYSRGTDVGELHEVYEWRHASRRADNQALTSTTS